TSFISESTVPRTTPRLASMRWIVATERPAASASARWSSSRSARAALSCPAVIKGELGISRCETAVVGYNSAILPAHVKKLVKGPEAAESERGQPPRAALWTLLAPGGGQLAEAASFAAACASS